jgi:hypothetical protein
MAGAFKYLLAIRCLPLLPQNPHQIPKHREVDQQEAETEPVQMVPELIELPGEK